jgi:hypothetical protein
LRVSTPQLQKPVGSSDKEITPVILSVIAVVLLVDGAAAF